MMAVMIIGAVGLTLLIAISTLVQMFYLESLRLRARDSAAQQFFKEHLEERLGVKPERGALAYSLLKHTAIVLLGIVFLRIAAAGGHAWWQVTVQAALLSWIVMIIAAYFVPQMLYRRALVGWVLYLTPVLLVLELAVRPVTVVLGFVQSLFEDTAHGQAAPENGNQTENIDALITAGAEEGIIQEEDRKLIQSVVAFGDKTVREVMTPRPSIVAIGHDKTLDDLRQLVINEQYSRIPVYEDTIDQIIGFVHVRDMFELDERERTIKTVRELVREIDHVPESKPVNDLLREMQEKGTHMAVVVDEYGNTAGLATMEDLVEEILGEIRDEHEPTTDVTPDESGAYILSGSYDVDHLADLVGYRRSDGTESTTVGGLVTEWMGRVPRAGEVVEREGIRIEILAGNDLRVEQVRVSPLPQSSVNA
jgi:magnesium and cobalt exporter, CNNM family